METELKRDMKTEARAEAESPSAIEIEAGVENGIKTGKDIEEADSMDKRRQGLMNLIRRVHGMVENTDIEKHRQSQDYIGTILSNTKAIEYREVDISGMYGEWVGVNRAHMKKYVLLHCHGGGYSTGSSLYARTLTSKLAESTSMDVLCFDYRLAPEHPYPAALEDAMQAWNYLMLLGYGARDVIVTGDSAGGNLALALTLKLKEEKRLLPRGIILMSPWTDLTSSGKSFQTKAEADPVLNCAYIDRMVHAYAEGHDLTDSLISPLFGDFEGFPPTYIQVGENEILLSDALRLHRTFIEKNVPVKIDIYPGMWHVFQMSPVKAARAAMDKNAEFIFDVCR
nr:alpha/beta hydrolase [uncultured Acetatifactor sp.]